MAQNTTNMNIRFSENEKMILLDIDKIFNLAFGEDIFTTCDMSFIELNITDINGQTSTINNTYTKFLYDNNFRINNNIVITNSSDLDLSSIPTYRFEPTIPVKLSSATAVTRLSFTKNQSKVYSLSFDTFDYDSDNEFDFTIGIKIHVCLLSKDGKASHDYYIYTTASVDSNPICNYKFYNKCADTINSNMESFMLLRTNPKLTGNIKLVVDSEDNLYLDTFKVSTTSVLNNKEYRHFTISNNGNYPHDIYKAFHTVPQGELYSVYDDSYDPHKNYYDMNLQIENIYEYGAENNNDKLYSENMKILAPLYIGKHLPTYFVVFRTDRIITDNYVTAPADVFNQMLKDAKAVKIFDLRKKTNIGKYLNSYKDQIQTYLSGTCALLFIEQHYDATDENYRLGVNTWKGISIYKGIFADKSETTYFATNTINGSNPQENYNMFLLNGFERNNLIYPNIINLEYMFNDEDTTDMSLHNYFGLYLTENDFLTFKLVARVNEERKTIYYDNDNKVIDFNNSKVTILENADYKDRIFFMTTSNDAEYVKTKDESRLFIENNVINQPDGNLISIKTDEVEIPESVKSFITIDFSKQLEIGEHIKFVALNTYNKNKKEHIVLEIIASNDPRLASSINNIYPYVLTNTPEYTIAPFNDKITLIYRLTFYALDLNDSTALASLEDLIKRIIACINKFNSYIHVESYDNNTLGISSEYKDTYVQHILSDITLSTNGVDTLRYFNANNVLNCLVTKYLPDLYSQLELPFALTGMEVLGDRYTNIVKFITTDYYANYNVYSTERDIYEDLVDVQYPIIATSNDAYGPLVKHKCYNCKVLYTDEVKGSSITKTLVEYNSIVDPFDVAKSIVVTPESIIKGAYSNNQETEAHLINNGNLSIYKPMACNLALMGINMIKDIDMYVNYSESTTYKSTYSSILYKDENIKLDNSDNRIHLFVPYKINYGSISGIPASANTIFYITNTEIIYSNDSNDISGTITRRDDTLKVLEDTEVELSNTSMFDTYNYTSTTPVMNEDAYYTDITNKSTSSLNIPLVPLVNCQWKSNGTYFDNNSILDTLALLRNYSKDGNFIEMLYNTAGNMKNQYIINMLTDKTSYKNMKVKDLLITNDYANFTKKYLVDNFKIDTGIAYYNSIVQTLTFVYYGINFVISLTNPQYKNEILLNEYDNYEVYIINDYDSTGKNEMIVNLVEEFILIINHTFINHGNFFNDNISLLNTDGNIESAQYNWFSNLYTYKFSNSAFLNDSIYLQKSNTYDFDKDAKIYVLLDTVGNIDNDENDLYYVLNTKNAQLFENHAGYDVIYKDNNNLYTLLSYDNDSTDDEVIYDAYEDNITETYLNENGNKKEDYRDRTSYIIKYVQNYTSLTGNALLQAYMNSFDITNMYLYIIHQNNETTALDINDSYLPLKLNISYADNIKYNQGLFDPNFKDIFEFNMNDTISDILDIDTLYANTSVKSINTIKSYYSNKIMDNNKYCTYNYFKDEERNVLSTCWDKNIYRLYTSDTNFSYLNGYTTGIQDKVFLGSMCMCFKHDDITLSTWNTKYNYGDVTESNSDKSGKANLMYEIKLNLTKTFINYMQYNTSFTDNWNITPDNINIKVNINNYINNTLINMYDFNSGVEVKLFEKYDRETVSVEDCFINSRPDDFDEYTQRTDITTNFKTVNDEVILTIDIYKHSNNTYGNYRYYPVIKITRK